MADARPVAPAGTSGLPSARFLGNASTSILQVQFLRRKAAAAAGLAYAIQFSADLVNWSSNQTPAVTSLNADWERVTVRDAASPNPNRFARVVLALQP